jgi:hypothetical protein
MPSQAIVSLIDLTGLSLGEKSADPNHIFA